MNEHVCLLITVYYENACVLMRCAIKVKRDALPEDCIQYPMAPENRQLLHGLLPMHVRSCGPVVDAEEIFEVHVNEERER